MRGSFGIGAFLCALSFAHPAHSSPVIPCDPVEVVYVFKAVQPVLSKTQDRDTIDFQVRVVVGGGRGTCSFDEPNYSLSSVDLIEDERIFSVPGRCLVGLSYPLDQISVAPDTGGSRYLHFVARQSAQPENAESVNFVVRPSGLFGQVKTSCSRSGR